MRFRGKSIRRKIVALLLVPLVSLTAIWGFATFLTGREANKLIDTAYILDDLARPLQDTVEVVQEERRQTLVYLADPRASDALAALRRSRVATDRLVAKIESKARNSDAREALDGQSEERLSVALDSFKGLDALRRTVEDGTISRDKALKMYTRLTDPCFGFLMTLNALDDVGVTAEGRALVGVGQVRELLSREDALIGSALVAGTVTKGEIRQVSDLVAQRGVLLDNSLTQLPNNERARFERYLNGAETSRLRDAEQLLMDSGGGTPARSRPATGTASRTRSSPASPTAPMTPSTACATAPAPRPSPSSCNWPSPACSACSPCSCPSSSPYASAAASSATCAACAWRPMRPPASGCPDCCAVSRRASRSTWRPKRRA